MLRKATFTATQIAEALGMPRPTVHRALDGMQPSGTRLVANNPAAVWSIADLPQEIRARVAALQRARGHITAEQICSKEAAAWWKPALPLHRIHSEDLADARKLQTALGRGLALADSATMKAREELAAPDYAAAFGRTVSDR